MAKRILPKAFQALSVPQGLPPTSSCHNGGRTGRQLRRNDPQPSQPSSNPNRSESRGKPE